MSASPEIGASHPGSPNSGRLHARVADLDDRQRLADEGVPRAVFAHGKPRRETCILISELLRLPSKKTWIASALQVATTCVKRRAGSGVRNLRRVAPHFNVSRPCTCLGLTQNSSDRASATSSPASTEFVETDNSEGSFDAPARWASAAGWSTRTAAAYERAPESADREAAIGTTAAARIAADTATSTARRPATRASARNSELRMRHLKRQGKEGRRSPRVNARLDRDRRRPATLASLSGSHNQTDVHLINQYWSSGTVLDCGPGAERAGDAKHLACPLTPAPRPARVDLGRPSHDAAYIASATPSTERARRHCSRR